MEIVLHQINVHVIQDGVVQHVINAKMDIIQMVVEIVYNVVIVIIMEYVQMDQMEMVFVRVIQVIQPQIVQLIIVPLVHMVIFCKVQLVPNVLRSVKLVNSIQLIVLRTIFFSFLHILQFSLIFFFLFRCKSGYVLQPYNNTCTSNCGYGTYFETSSCTRMVLLLLLYTVSWTITTFNFFFFFLK